MLQDWSEFNKYYADQITNNPLSEQYLQKFGTFRLIDENEDTVQQKGETGANTDCSLIVSPQELYFIERAFENRNFSVVEELNEEEPG